MIYLSVYCLLTILAFIWIRIDYETGYVFDVFGKNFHWVWFEYGKRWQTVATYGWRLLLLAGLVITNVVLAYFVFDDNPFNLPTWAQIVLHLAMMLAALAIVPWVHKAQNMRWWRALRRTARALRQPVLEIAILGNTSKFAPASECIVTPPWTAWYPRPQWKGIKPFYFQPLVYFVADETVLVMVSGGEFLSWNAQAGFPEIGSTLPFDVGLSLSHRVTSVWPLGREAGCCLVSTEIVDDFYCPNDACSTGPTSEGPTAPSASPNQPPAPHAVSPTIGSCHGLSQPAAGTAVPVGSIEQHIPRFRGAVPLCLPDRNSHKNAPRVRRSLCRTDLTSRQTCRALF